MRSGSLGENWQWNMLQKQPFCNGLPSKPAKSWKIILSIRYLPVCCLKPRSHIHCNLSATTLRPKNSCNQCNHRATNTAILQLQIVRRSIANQLGSGWRLVGDWLPIDWRWAATGRWSVDDWLIRIQKARTIVSRPNPKQCVIVHIFDLMMIIRQSIYILSIIAREMGKLKTHSTTYFIMDHWENMHYLTHSTDYIWQAFYKFNVFR